MESVDSIFGEANLNKRCKCKLTQQCLDHRNLLLSHKRYRLPTTLAINVPLHGFAHSGKIVVPIKSSLETLNYLSIWSTHRYTLFFL